MFGIFGTQLAYSAVSVVAKKAFETSVAQSLKGIGEAINRRYRGNVELLQLKDELEMKLKMLCLPVDICAHYVTQGNTALQEALGVALRVLQHIEQFQASLVQLDISRAQGDTSSPDPVATTATHIKELRGLISSLDSLLPYLNLAISAAGLLASAEPYAWSPSRLMAASWRLRSAQADAPILTLQQATWHQEQQLTSAGPSMSEAYPLCSIRVQRSGGCLAAARSATEGAWGYDLVVQQDLKDGRHHEEGEQPLQTCIKVSNILGMEWATTQSLNQGQNEYRPALVLHVDCRTVCGSDANSTAHGAASMHSKELASPVPITPPTMATRSSSRVGSDRSNAPTASSSASKAVPGQQPGSKAPTSGAGAGAAPVISTTNHAVTPVVVEFGGSAAAGDGSCTARLVRRYAIQCSCQPSRCVEGDAGGAGEEDPEEEDELETEGDDPSTAPSPEEWAALGELEYVLRLCILETTEQVAHYEVQDERIRMAFEAITVLPAATGPAAATAVGAIGGGRGSTVRRASTTARRRSAVRGLGVAGGTGAATLNQTESAEVDAMAVELGRRLAFSGDASPVRGRGFGSPLQ